MAILQVTATRKDSNSEILGLCGNWTLSYVSKADAIVVDTRYGKYLRTDADSTITNNLAYLPNC